jgi:multiple sugar transport system substrate-binding protein
MPSITKEKEPVAMPAGFDRTAIRACLIGVVLAALFAFLFVAPSHDPTPNNLPVAVAGSEEAAAPLVRALERNEGEFDVVRLADAGEARKAVLDREVYGAFVLTRPNAPELFVATAASPSVAGVLEEVAAGAAAGSEPLKTNDLRSLDDDDSRGTTINATTLSVMSIVSVLSAVLLFMMAPGLGGPARFAGLALISVLGGLLSMGVISLGIGAIPGSYLALSAVVALGMLCASSVSAAIIGRMGMVGIGVSFIIFLALASPATGASSDPHLLPDPWSWAGQLLPPGAAATALRDVAYFDGAMSGAWLPVLLGWAALGAVMVLFSSRREDTAPAAPEPEPERPRERSAERPPSLLEVSPMSGGALPLPRATPSSPGATRAPSGATTPAAPSSGRGRRPQLRLPQFIRSRPQVIAGITAALIGVVVLVAILSGGDDTGSDGGKLSTVKVIDPGSMSDGQGTVTYCTGKDIVTSRDGRMHQHEEALKGFNEKFGPDLHANFVEFPDEAPQQYEQFSRRQRARSGECDVFYSDVTWTADFANNGWLIDLSPYVKPRLNSFVPAMRDAAIFNDKIWGVPKQADAGLLYYNKDSVKDPPTTWQQLYKQAAAGRGKRYRYQGLDYEGLTVNFLELAYAAGAQDIVTPKRKANITQYPALVALQFMVEGVKNGVVPYDIVNQKEAASLNAFGHERAAFMRNWPYAYAALNDRTKYPDVAGNVGVAPLPSWQGQAPSSVLGGHILVISAFSKNTAGALQLVDYLSSAEVIKQDATDFSLAPALVDLWNDPQVQKSLPAFSDLRSAIFNAKARPVTPNYADVSEAISKNVNRALRGSLDPQSALATANDEMQEALDEAYRTVP